MNSCKQLTYRVQMGFTHRELLKGLPNAVAPYKIDKKSELVYLVSFEDRIAVLTMSPERERKIAALVLPVIDVEIEFENFNEQQYENFLDRFKRFLHRGGG